MINEKNTSSDGEEEDEEEELEQDKKKYKKIKTKKEEFYLDIEITDNNIYETYNISNYNSNTSHNSSLLMKRFNYKDIDSFIFCPLIQKENEFNFFRQTLELFKSENNELFMNYYNNLSEEDKKNLQEIVNTQNSN